MEFIIFVKIKEFYVSGFIDVGVGKMSIIKEVNFIQIFVAFIAFFTIQVN